jgi:hypothetical protein
MNSNTRLQDKVFIDAKRKESTVVQSDRLRIDEIILQLQWIGGIEDQILFANTEALSDFTLELKVLPRHDNNSYSSYFQKGMRIR